MALALNNLKRVDMPLNKETKPNQTKPDVSFYHNSSVWLDKLDPLSWDRKPVDSNANPRLSIYIYIIVCVCVCVCVLFRQV